MAAASPGWTGIAFPLERYMAHGASGGWREVVMPQERGGIANPAPLRS